MSLSVPFSLASCLLVSDGRMIMVLAVLVLPELLEAPVIARVPDVVVF